MTLGSEYSAAGTVAALLPGMGSGTRREPIHGRLSARPLSQTVPTPIPGKQGLRVEFSCIVHQARKKTEIKCEGSAAGGRLRDCRPEGPGRQAYRDVFTARPVNGHRQQGRQERTYRHHYQP